MKPYRKRWINQVVLAFAVGLFGLLALACTAAKSSAEPNPTASPTVSPTPTPPPTPQVFEVIPYELPVTPTPTAAPRGVVQDSQYLQHPEWLIPRAMGHIRYRDHVVVSGEFTITVTNSAGAPVDVKVSVAGDYDAEVFSEASYDPFVYFDLQFHHEAVQSSSPEPWDTRIEVHQGFVRQDTTDNNFWTYATHAEYRAYGGALDPNKVPSMPMFLSLALTEDRILEYRLLYWMQFSPDQVELIAVPGEDGSDAWVVKATRPAPEGDIQDLEGAFQPGPHGDVEEWTFWIGEDQMLRRIELTISNEDSPDRELRDGVLEFIEIGECLPEPLPCNR